MDKKPLIVVSILAVVLLVLGLLSNVVGYQSVNSSVVNDSPLFIARTQRAINERQNIITSQFLSKGKDSISFPLLDNKTSMNQKFINQIRTVDDNAFSKFVKNTIRLLIQQGTVKYCDIKDIENGFYQLRENSEVYDDSINLNNGNYTWRITPSICWFPGCFLFTFFLIFLLTVGFHCFPTEKICITPFIYHQ